ncbi:hypothetical protein GGR58DRAFT_509367 [Xylaria digitata]|nr:hypothetical protein GGR58DRAFT_509367 [Xylaria digitata]
MATKLTVHLFVLLLSKLMLCQSLSPAPSVGNYLCRRGHTITVIGDWLYLDGGEISQLVNGTLVGASQNFWFYKINHTLSIPLHESWSTETVTWKLTKKEAPVFLFATLWTYQDTWINWGGQESLGDTIYAYDPWQFTSDGNGGGEWSPSNPYNRADFVGITRTWGGAGASCNGKGLYVGGIVGELPLPGLITCDIETRTWSNESALGLNRFGTSVSGAGACLEEHGSEGVLFVIGGDLVDQSPYSQKAGLIDMRNIGFWNVGTKTWHSQITNGETPSIRLKHCLSVAKSPDNTYEIYLYGGSNSNQYYALDDVWILSIPAFTWFKVDTHGSTSRQDHSCHTAGNQIISIGGYPSVINSTDPDEWNQGIGVLDLSSWRWTGQYRANTTYATPQFIKDWYRERDLDTDVNWTSDAVRQLFLSDDTPPSEDPSSPMKHQTDSSKGAIIGGSIGGVVVFLGVAVTVVLLLRRRNQEGQKNQREGKEISEMPIFSFPGTHNRPELDRDERPGEMSSERHGSPFELDDTQLIHQLFDRRHDDRKFSQQL